MEIDQVSDDLVFLAEKVCELFVNQPDFYRAAVIAKMHLRLLKEEPRYEGLVNVLRDAELEDTQEVKNEH